MSETKIHVCDCFTHGFSVNADAELGVVFLASWTQGRAGQDLAWADRIRWAWKVVSTGQPYDDELVLSPESAERLAQALMGASSHASKKRIGESKSDCH